MDNGGLSTWKYSCSILGVMNIRTALNVLAMYRRNSETLEMLDYMKQY